MLSKFIVAIILGVSVLSNTGFAADALVYGMVKNHHVNDILKELHQKESQAIQSALNKSLTYKVFPNYDAELNVLKSNPNELSFLYVKEQTVPEVSKIGHWKKIAQVASMDPKTHQLSNTYSSYIITAKNSKITQLNDLANKKIVYYKEYSMSNYIAVKKLIEDNKIEHVQWVKAADLKQAYDMLSSGKADALGTWDYYFINPTEKDKYKLVYTINNLENPYLYANTNKLSADEIQKVKTALQKMGQTTNGFAYN